MNNILDDNRPNRPKSYNVEFGMCFVVLGLAGFVTILSNPRYLPSMGKFILDIFVFSFLIWIGYNLITNKE